MNYPTWDSPGYGIPIPAEEFAAACGSGAGSCPGTDQGCTCEQSGCGPVLCWCQPAHVPHPTPVPDPEDGCCCKASMRAALQLLSDNCLASLINFSGAAFVTNDYVAGSTINTTVPTTTPVDNLTTLSGSFLRLSPCNCDLLDINAALYDPPGTSTGVTATQISLCELAGVAFSVAQATAEGDLTGPEATTRNYRNLKQLLSCRLTPCNSRCGECSCKCGGGDCCCTDGILSMLADNNLSRRVTLVAGKLVLQGVTLLGTLGNVLVLANDSSQRIYFVCANKVQFLG